MSGSMGIGISIIYDCPVFSFPENSFIGLEINTKRTIFFSEHIFTCEFLFEIISSSELYIDIFHQKNLGIKDDIKIFSKENLILRQVIFY
jgi:hypothetical protein